MTDTRRATQMAKMYDPSNHGLEAQSLREVSPLIAAAYICHILLNKVSDTVPNLSSRTLATQRRMNICRNYQSGSPELTLRIYMGDLTLPFSYGSPWADVRADIRTDVSREWDGSTYTPIGSHNCEQAEI